MTIASEITRITGNIADSYTAASGKGATIPATQNSDNLATCIASIPSGGSSTKYGVSMDDLLGDVDNNGVLQASAQQYTFTLPNTANDVGDKGLAGKFMSTQLTSVDFSSLTTISGNNAFYQAFNRCTSLTSVSFPELTTVSQGSFSNAFYGCTSLTSVSFPKLTTVDQGSFNNAFYGCTSLTSVSFPELTTANGQDSLGNAFYGCTSLTSVSFPKLTTLGSSTFSSTFNRCTSLTDVYFPALTTSSFTNINAFSNMLSISGSTVNHTLHFPSNMETTISGLTGYPRFGGASGYVTLLYDLPATS